MASRSVAAFAASTIALTSSAPALAADAYDPPPTYYPSFDGLDGPGLRNAIHVAISTGHVLRTYAAAIFALPILDRDPNDASRIILVYNGASVPALWDSGVTWNREHTWPDSRGLGGSGMDYSDLHQLRGCNPSINSSRGNEPFGFESGPGGSSSFWDPDRFGVPFRGEMARAMMYMDVRYDGLDASTTDLVLVNGFPSGSQMGDKVAMLEWHFEQPPSQTERRRNHFVYSSVDNPNYFQGNRNPFVDHPELVWAIFGTQPNTSTLFVGPGAGGAGASEVTIDLGAVVDGGDVTTEFVLSKSGATPTTYTLEPFGDASLAFDGRRQAFASGPRQRAVSVTLTGLSASGLLDSGVIVDNTDLTSAAPGQGAEDAPDVVRFTASLLNGANASWSFKDDENSHPIDLGAVPEGGSASASTFITNVGAPPTAGLDLDFIEGSGDHEAFVLTPATFTGLPAGQSIEFTVSLAPGAPSGMLQAIYTLHVSDADIPGAQPRFPLTLVVSAQVIGCAADLTGDGHVGAADLAAVLGAWGPGAGPADLTGDGQVTSADLAALLGAWGPCP